MTTALAAAAAPPLSSPAAPADPSLQRYKIALCQLPVSPSKPRNLASARARIQSAAADGARLVVLPEMWCCPYSMDNMADYAEDIDGGDSPSISMLAEVAALCRITIVGGSVPERLPAGKMFNTCCVLGPDGNIIAKHRKLHLFDIDITGDITFRESDTFEYGPEPTTVDTELGRIGIGICHDIRFPELAMVYQSRGAHLICYPAAFNVSTGQLLWELMLRSRAADNQLYVAACSPSREPDSKSDFMVWGHSTLTGPSGEIIAKAETDEATVYGEVDHSVIQSRRQSLPLELHRRCDVYNMVDIKHASS